MDERAAAERGRKASIYFLESGDFDGCRKYALRALQSYPNLPSIPEILAIADVHLAAGTLIAGTEVDWYRVLKVNRFSTNTHFITHQFNNLHSLLNPYSNKFKFAAEAYDLVLNAWTILSDPVKRCSFDTFLRSSEPGNCGEVFEENYTFWTICPYCYYVYEFAKGYEDCCLKCQNGKCGRSFQAVEIASPPNQVVQDGKYKCFGFYQLGFGSDGGNGSSSWTPFVPKKNDLKPNCNIIDDSDDISKGEKMSKTPKKMKSSVKVSNKLMGRGNRIGSQETFGHGGEQLDLNNQNHGNAQDSGSMMGRGTIIETQEMFGHGGGQLDLNNQNHGNDQDSGSMFAERMQNTVDIFQQDMFIRFHGDGF